MVEPTTTNELTQAEALAEIYGDEVLTRVSLLVAMTHLDEDRVQGDIAEVPGAVANAWIAMKLAKAA